MGNHRYFMDRVAIMKKINARFVYNEDGIKIGVILDVGEFEKCIDALEDYQDYVLIKQRSAKKEKLISHEEVVRNTLKRI